MMTLRGRLMLCFAGVLVIVAAAGVALIFLNDRRVQVGLMVFGALYAGLFLLAIGRWVILPVRRLGEAAQAVQNGKLYIPLQVTWDDEIGQLARTFNTMAQALQELRQQDEARVVRAQEAARLAINSLPHVVIVLSPEGRLELVNRVAEGLFGMRVGEEAPEGARRWLDPLMEEARRTLTKVDPRGYASAVQVFDKGEERLFLPHAIPVLDSARKVVGVTVLLEDATRLRQVDEAKSGLLATVSHELKTPLTSIQMALHLLVEDSPAGLSARQMELLKTACEDADRLQGLIQKLLDAGRQGDAGTTP